MRSVFCLLLLAPLLFGCGLLFSQPKAPHTVFVLGSLDSAPVSDAMRGTHGRLVIEAVSAPAFIDNERMLFSRNGQTIGSYQYSSWAQSPAKRLTDLMIEKFENAGAFASIGRGAGVVVGDYILVSELRDFYHNVESSPGKVIASMRVELVNLNSHQVEASRAFTREVPAASYDAKGAADAFSSAVDLLLGDVVEWVESSVN